MPEIQTVSETASVDSVMNTPGVDELLTQAAESLESNHVLDVYEGEFTGALYTETSGGYAQLEIAETGPTLHTVTEPREDLTQLIRIEPSDDESIEDAADNVQYTGGD